MQLLQVRDIFCPQSLTALQHADCRWQASFIRAILQGGAGGLGGRVFSWVGGSKGLDPHPSYHSEGFLGWAPATPSFYGHRSLVWLFAGALFCFVVVQVAGLQVAIFQMADLFFLITS